MDNNEKNEGVVGVDVAHLAGRAFGFLGSAFVAPTTTTECKINIAQRHTPKRQSKRYLAAGCVLDTFRVKGLNDEGLSPNTSHCSMTSATDVGL